MEPDKAFLRVGVTGANGYVGGAIARAFADAGHEVVVLTRTPAGAYEHRNYDLTAQVPPSLLEGIDIVIHCAYDWAPTDWKEIVRVNIESTRALLEAASASGARLTLISSVSAFDGTRQKYGRAKLACERLTLDAGGNAVRLGTVYGGANGGVFGLLLRAARLPLIPVFAAHSRQTLIRLESVTEALVALAESDAHGQLLGLANPSSVELGQLMRAISSTKAQSSVIVPVPWLPIYLLLRLVEGAGVGLPVGSETVLGLARPPKTLINSEKLWQSLGVKLDASDFSADGWTD